MAWMGKKEKTAYKIIFKQYKKVDEHKSFINITKFLKARNHFLSNSCTEIHTCSVHIDIWGIIHILPTLVVEFCSEDIAWLLFSWTDGEMAEIYFNSNLEGKTPLISHYISQQNCKDVESFHWNCSGWIVSARFGKKMQKLLNLKACT